jgi:hypothetical protein
MGSAKSHQLTRNGKAMAIVYVGIDLAKNVFALNRVNATGAVQLRQPKLARGKLNEVVAALPPCTIGIEACTGAHHWARLFTAHGHTVKQGPARPCRCEHDDDLHARAQSRWRSRAQPVGCTRAGVGRPAGRDAAPRVRAARTRARLRAGLARGCLGIACRGVRHAAPRQRDRFAQHVQVANVVGQQQQQTGLHQIALLVAEAAVGGNQRFVESVAGAVRVALVLAGAEEMGFGVEVSGHAGSPVWVARASAARKAAASKRRQRAATCWSGRIR